jgi:hypothetical protein
MDDLHVRAHGNFATASRCGDHAYNLSPERRAETATQASIDAASTARFIALGLMHLSTQINVMDKKLDRIIEKLGIR